MGQERGKSAVRSLATGCTNSANDLADTAPDFLRLALENIDFWRRLNPKCKISDDPWPRNIEPYQISPAEMAEHAATMRREGYFQTKPIIPQNDLDTLVNCISNLVPWKFPLKYAFVYDEFYSVIARLSDVLNPILGAGYQLVPHELNVFSIPVGDDARGFAPHRDYLRKSIGLDGLPELVNVWIALTDATPLNSCLYVLPGHLDPLYPDGPQFEVGDPREFLQNIRALPAKAGSILCWNTSLLHWGGRSSDQATHPRLSFAVYCQSRELSPVHPTVMDIPSLIPFTHRVYLIRNSPFA